MSSFLCPSPYLPVPSSRLSLRSPKEYSCIQPAPGAACEYTHNQQPHNQKIYRYIREPIRIYKYLTLVYIIYIKIRIILIKIQNISIKYE